jgi:flagellar biosynthetic protein FliQ
MTQDLVLEIANRALVTTLTVAAPLLLAGLIVGLAISIFQAVTQIHEMTLTFIPKILVLFLSLMLFLPWMLGTFIGFVAELFKSIPTFSH